MGWRHETDTGIVEFNGMETRDRHRYCRIYWDGDTRWVQVLWRLLEWGHEMGTDILEFIGIETRDGHRYLGAYCDGDTRWAQVFWRLLE